MMRAAPFWTILRALLDLRLEHTVTLGGVTFTRERVDGPITADVPDDAWDDDAVARALVSEMDVEAARVLAAHPAAMGGAV